MCRKAPTRVFSGSVWALSSLFLVTSCSRLSATSSREVLITPEAAAIAGSTNATTPTTAGSTGIALPTETSLPSATQTQTPTTAMQPQQPVTATPFSGQSIQTQRVRSQCGVGFEIPTTWKVSEEETELYSGYTCALGVRPPNWEQLADKSDYVLNEYAILVVVHPGPFEQAAKQALFENVDGIWYATGGGRGGALEADLILSDGLTILRGISPYGLMIEDGESYGGLGVAVRALLTDRSGRVVILETDLDTVVEPVSLEEAFELILRTLHF